LPALREGALINAVNLSILWNFQPSPKQKGGKHVRDVNDLSALLSC